MPTRRFGPFLLLLVAACDALAPENPGGDTSISLQLIATQNAALSDADHGWVHVRGVSNESVEITPGSTVTIKDLLPGFYTVSFEGLTEVEEVVVFGEETDVGVNAGRTTDVAITVNSFVPTLQPITEIVGIGDSLLVEFNALDGAHQYRIEIADDPSFSNSLATDTVATSLYVPLGEVGTHYVRVRAQSRFGSWGQACFPQTVEVGTL